MKPRIAWAWGSPRWANVIVRLTEAAWSLRPAAARAFTREAACATGTAPIKRMNPAETRRAILGMIFSPAFPLERGGRGIEEQRRFKNPGDPDCGRQEQAERQSRGRPDGPAEIKVQDQASS